MKNSLNRLKKMVNFYLGWSVEHIKSESLRGVFYIDDAFRLVTYNIHSGDKRPIAHIATMKNFETVACVYRRRKLFSLFDHSELTN